MSKPPPVERVFVVGTRCVLRRNQDGNYRYVVACASCEHQGPRSYRSKDAACSVAVRRSDRACRQCGAN